MSGPRLFALIYRLPAYDGVLTARIAAETPQDRTEAPGTARYVDSTQTALKTDPALSGLIEF